MELPDEIKGTGYLDGLPMLREITESDWRLIEYLAELCRQRGDVFTSGTATAERAREVMEMPGAAILSIVGHLALLRPDDLLEALEIADLSDAVLSRKADQQQEREREARRRNAAMQARATRQQRRDEVWTAAQANPTEALSDLRLIALRLQNEEISRSQARLLMAGRIGISTALPAGEIEPELERRQLLLIQLEQGNAPAAQAPPEPPEPPAPEPEPAPAEPPAPAQPEPLAVLCREALDWQPEHTLLHSLQQWEKRRHQPAAWNYNHDWRDAFRLPNDFIQGQQAVVLVSRATGVRVELVQAHADALAARAAQQRKAVASAWPSLGELLADAETAGGWLELAMCARTSPDSLLAHAQALLRGAPASPQW